MFVDVLLFSCSFLSCLFSPLVYVDISFFFLSAVSTFLLLSIAGLPLLRIDANLNTLGIALEVSNCFRPSSIQPVVSFDMWFVIIDLKKYKLPEMLDITRAVRQGNLRLFEDSLQKYQLYFVNKGRK